jgi:hypothetical protein
VIRVCIAEVGQSAKHTPLRLATVVGGAAVALFALSLALPGRCAAADPEPKFSVGVEAGAALPLGDDSDLLDLGFFTGLVVHYRLQDHFAAGARAAYQMERGSSAFRRTLQVGQIEATTYSYGAEGQWLPAGTRPGLVPSVTLGVAYYAMRIDPRGSASSSDQAMGASLGGGLGYTTKSNVRLELFAQYHNVFTQGDATKFVTAGTRLMVGLVGP